MAKAKKVSIKKDALQVPSTLNEAETLLAKMGSHQRKVIDNENEMNEAVANTKAGYTKIKNKLNDDIDEMSTALHAWAEVNKTNLLKGDAKTAKLSTGELSWRLTPWKVTLKKVDDILVALKEAKLKKFIRTKDEVDKEAILKDENSRAAAKAIKGISISRKTEFVIKPAETNIERAGEVKKAA